MSFYQLTAKLSSGEELSFATLKNQVVLIVNTATGCGLANQLKDLEAIYKKYKENEFTVLAFPCNQFANQEKGSIEEVCSILKTDFHATFTIMDKIDVNGDNAHPVFQYLKNHSKGVITSDIKWNFTKFLIDRSGNIVERFAPTTGINKIERDLINYL